MSPLRKRLALAFVVVGLGLIVAHTLASGDDGDVVAPAAPVGQGIASASLEPAAAARTPAPGASTADGSSSAAPLGLAQFKAGEAARAAAAAPPDRGDLLFAVQTWQPPAPPPPPAPEPEVPPFPYTYLGGLTDEGGRVAFFGQGERMLPLRSGDTVDGAWHVDHLDDHQMTLTYLALRQTRVVPAGAGR